MALRPGTRLGAYEVTALIGEGGMGQVYRARDTRLDRDVAIKVLPEAFAHDAARLARFQREAKTLASLNHPNIGQIYGLETSGGMTALVMEFVDGEDLSQRIALGAIPLDEALPIARQIAEALEAAHEQGIVHRDLKPANIKVRSDGTVKVLDFGLAKAMEPVSALSASAGQALSQLPTITSPAMMTGAGMILGTAAYMSPEQARGKPVDKRADIWAFGVVLFEMLTGTRPFDGEDMTEVMGAVVRLEPEWALLPADVPPLVRTLLQSSLVKDPRHRVADISTALFVLDKAASVAAAPVASTTAHDGPRAAASWKRVALVGTAALILGAALTGGAMWIATPSAVPRLTHTAITLTPELPLSPTPIALSPDGQTLAMTAGNQLVLRRLDNPKLTPLPGTEGASNPFFSPDGDWVGFVADGELRRIRTDGTNRQTIGTLGRSPTSSLNWGVDDAIYFGLGGLGLFRVPAAGGAASPVTQPRREVGEISHDSPQMLEDGRTILFTLRHADGNMAALLNVASGEWRAIPGITSDFARYAPSGHLIYRRGGGVFATTVSLGAATTTGAQQALFDGVLERQSVPFALSPDGVLAYLPSSIDTDFEGRISTVTRSGAVETVVDANVVRLLPNVTSQLRFSFDGRTVVAVLQNDSNSSDLWTYDLSRGAGTRLTDRGPINTAPVWSPDGTQVAFNSTREPTGIYLQSIDTPRSAKLLLERGLAGGQSPGTWSPDGRSLVFNENNPRTGTDLWTVRLDGKISPLLVTPAREWAPRLSPDGRWLAYQSDTAGRDDVYVASFPTLGRTQLVSIDGGTSPRWAGAREIVYRQGRQVLSVTVTPGETLTLGRPTVLFEIDDVVDSYDVSPDGTRFLVLHRDAARAGAAPGQVNLVLNLFEELTRLAPTN